MTPILELKAVRPMNATGFCGQKTGASRGSSMRARARRATRIARPPQPVAALAGARRIGLLAPAVCVPASWGSPTFDAG